MFLKSVKLIFIAAILLLTGNYIQAQDTMQDVLYLKNGGIIRGIIMEQVPEQTIKIQIANKNVFIYKIDEIEKITKESYSTDANAQVTSYHIHTEKEKGYFNIIEAGFEFGADYLGKLFGTAKNQFPYGSSTNQYTSVDIHDINGIKFSKNSILGIGVGFDWYFPKGASTLELKYIPLFIDWRKAFSSGKNKSVFMEIAAGYNFGISQTETTIAPSFGPDYPFIEKSDVRNGFSINPSFGMKSLLSDKTVFYLSLGYKYFPVKIMYESTYHYHDLNSSSISTYHAASETNFRSGFIILKAGLGI